MEQTTQTVEEHKNQLEEIKALREQLQILKTERDLYKAAAFEMLSKGESAFLDVVKHYQAQKKTLGMIE